jgi:hypothetical protein
MFSYDLPASTLMVSVLFALITTTYHHRACGYLGLFFENPCITSFGAVPRTRIKCSNNNTGCICMSKLCELVTIN